MKKIAVCLVIFTVLLCVVSCGDSKKSDDKNDNGDTFSGEDTVDSDLIDSGHDEDNTEPSENTGETPEKSDPDDPDDSDATPIDDDDDSDTVPDSSDSLPDDDIDTIEPTDDAAAEELESDLPECTPASEMPCIDSETWLVWSEKTADKINWEDAVTYCEQLNEGGYGDWQLPGFEVLMTLRQNCEPVIFAENLGCNNTADAPFSKLGDDIPLWSSKPNYNKSGAVVVSFSTGAWESKDINNLYEARCVRIWKENRKRACSEIPQNTDWNSVSVIPQTWDWETAQWDPSEISVFSDETSKTECRFACVLGYQWTGVKCLAVPYYDADTGLTWSSMTPDKLTFDEAESYCDKLKEGGYSNWRLPTISELRTLVQNHDGAEPGGSCKVSDDCLSYKDCYTDYTTNGCSGRGSDPSGGYSKLGDINPFWSSSVDSDNPDLVWILYFDSGRFVEYEKNYPYYYARCVRK